MIVRFVFCCMFILFTLSGYSQRADLLDLESKNKGIIYKKEWSGEAMLFHSGFSLGYNNAKIYSFRKTNYYHFEIGYIGSPREQRQNKNFIELGLSKSFRYGKQNLFFPLKAAKGTKHYLSAKYTRKGIAVAWSYRYGPTLGILKPIYLDFFSFKDGVLNRNLESLKYTDENKETFLNYDRIYGGSGVFKGFSELRIIPGIHLNTALHFGAGAYEKYVRAMELGVNVDLYLKKIPIMVETEFIHNKPYFIKLYVNLQIGIREY